MTIKKRLKLGFLVNPYAGIGGEAALKGSDRVDVRDKALAYSDTLRTPERARRFLTALGPAARAIDWYSGEGLMGEMLLREFDCSLAGVEPVSSYPSSAEDSRRLVKTCITQAVDILVFVGGDGTARDVVDESGMHLPCLGVPGGVKMQSGVFAISPEAAASIVLRIASGESLGVSEQDVRDIDEQALREGRVHSRFYGSMQVPAEPAWLQRLKQGGVEDESLVLDEIAEHLTEIMQDSGAVMLAGPGTTIAHWMKNLGLANTLVGFDAIRDGQLLQQDLTAKDVLSLQQQYPDVYLVITPTGNQGFLLGRGNQQLSPSFIQQLPKEQWLIVASQSKLDTLQQRPLLVDSNDAELDRQIAGLYPIITAYHHQMLYPVNCSYQE